MNFLILISIFNCWSVEIKSEDEVSSVLTGGNTQLKSYDAKSESSISFDSHKVSLKGSYTYGEADNIRSAESWDSTLRYDLAFNERIGLLVGETIEAARFSGFRRRYSSDIGSKLTFPWWDKISTFAEFGYRYSVEKPVLNTLDNKKESKGRTYLELSGEVSETIKLKFWIEYLPNFSESSDYMVSFSPSLSVMLSDRFSLKISYLWKFDNLPSAGAGRYDYKTTTGLLATF